MLPALQNRLPVIIAAALLFLPGFALPQDKATAQQERMRACNSQAKEQSLKGEERQQFMSSCLKAERGGKQLTAQQERMKTCNAQAASRELKGEERKQFMSTCLKNEGASAGSGQELNAQQQRMRSCNAQASKKDLAGDERKRFIARCLQG